MSQIFVIFLSIAILLGLYFSGHFSDTDNPKSEHTASVTWSVEGIQETVRLRVENILSDSEVKKTLDRIERDDGYYKKDGAVFMNREKRLPIQRDKEYYAEWTVTTPWERDRGARRIIEGKWGELYFTDDHYRSFVRIR